MDLGIAGRRAIVCASSAGLGRACALALAKEGVHVVINGRRESLVQATAKEIGSTTGVEAMPVCCDITTPAGRTQVLAACPHPDILVTNAGGPPPGDFRAWGRDDWISAIDANMLAPIELIRLVIDGMIERRFGRIVNITSSAVKAPIPILGLSNGARAGLTGFVAGLARETVRHNVTINNLLPGPFQTDRLHATVKSVADRQQRPFDEVWAERAQANPAGRFGEPEEFGRACAFLCAAGSGYMTGQNLLLDGGAFPGTL